MSTLAMRSVSSSSGAAKTRWGAFACACIAGTALAMLASPAAAALYKWTDANGRVIYSDQPPTGNFKVEAINAPPPPSNPNAVKELAAKEVELQQKKLQRAEDDTKSAKARVDENKKREQCGKARGQIIALQGDSEHRVLPADEKGQQVYMDEAARRREREQLEVWIRDNCQS